MSSSFNVDKLTKEFELRDAEDLEKRLKPLTEVVKDGRVIKAIKESKPIKSIRERQWNESFRDTLPTINNHLKNLENTLKNVRAKHGSKNKDVELKWTMDIFQRA